MLGDVDLYALNRPASYTFLTETGQVLGHSGARVGDRVQLRELPPYLPAAFLAAEDRRFYSHPGVDIMGMVRATIANIKAGRIVAGGSTISQQTAKILALTGERTLGRKFREFGYAWGLERKLSKDELLTLYLNRIYLGSGTYGVDAAARLYFGKSARNVSLAEAAMLAGLTRAPSTYSPRSNLEAAQKRAKLVLAAMMETGAISAAQQEYAVSHPATLTPSALHEDAYGYVFDMVATETRAVSLDARGDLVVVTTLDPKLQNAVSKTATVLVDEAAKGANASQLAIVAMAPDGAIRALIGGRDYHESQFNRATQARRQPGSAFKPLVYMAALEAGYRPYRQLYDGPININGYRPHNYGLGYRGDVTMAVGLADSINTVAVRLLRYVGISNVIRTARRFGIESSLRAHASLALGTSELTPLELTSAYAVFASGGLAAKPYSVLEVRTASGTTVYKRSPGAAERVVAPKLAMDMDRMLYGAVAYGTGHRAVLEGHRVSGKTGTTSAYRDAWFIGYSENLVAGVWVGNDDFSPMKGVTGGSLPAQIWHNFMSDRLDTLRPSLFDRAAPNFATATVAERNPAGLMADRHVSAAPNS